MGLNDPSPPKPPEYLVLQVQSLLRTLDWDENGSLQQDYSDEEEQGDGPLTPLLPTYDDGEDTKPLPSPPRTPACHPLRLSLLLLLAAAGVAGWVAFDHYAPRGPPSVVSEADTFQDALQHNTSTPFPLEAAGSSAQMTDVLRFLAAAGQTNDGIVPFEPRIYYALFPSSRPLARTLSSKAFPSSRCADQWIARGELCTAMKGRWTGKEEELKLDVSWTWVNGSSAERMAQWRESVSESVGKRMKVRRTLGGTVLKHFR